MHLTFLKCILILQRIIVACDIFTGSEKCEAALLVQWRYCLFEGHLRVILVLDKFWKTDGVSRLGVAASLCMCGFHHL